MAYDSSLFFLAADFGSPKLDRLRADHSDRFINVGIAEQNLVNVATGLAMEGFTVYAYAIAPFLIMRAYEQIRNNLSLLSHTHEINVNLLGVGGGLSYDVSGPTHHSLEDISIIRTLPDIGLFSPSDWVLAEQFVEYTIQHKKPKYIRLDGKPLTNIYDPDHAIDIRKGFAELATGDDICIVSTGYMTHTALQAVKQLSYEGIKVGLIDMFLLKPVQEEEFCNAVRGYKNIVTIEEGFAGKGGMDSAINYLLQKKELNVSVTPMGFGDKYVFEIGSRECLHSLHGLDAKGIAATITKLSLKYS